MEIYTAEELGLPIPDAAGPDVVVMTRPRVPTPVRPRDDAGTQRGVRRENGSSAILQGCGFDVVLNPDVEGPKQPDNLIDGKIFDHLASATRDAQDIWGRGKREVDMV